MLVFLDYPFFFHTHLSFCWVVVTAQEKDTLSCDRVPGNLIL